MDIYRVGKYWIVAEPCGNRRFRAPVPGIWPERTATGALETITWMTPRYLAREDALRALLEWQGGYPSQAPEVEPGHEDRQAPRRSRRPARRCGAPLAQRREVCPGVRRRPGTGERTSDCEVLHDAPQTHFEASATAS